MEKNKEGVEEILNDFLQDPYPEDIFLPIPQEQYLQIHEMLKEKFNMPIDRLAGHIGRQLRKPLKEAAQIALANWRKEQGQEQEPVEGMRWVKASELNPTPENE